MCDEFIHPGLVSDPRLSRRSFGLITVATAGLASAASIHGYTTAFEWAAGLFAIGLLVALVILPSDGARRARVAQAEARNELTLSLETT